ncbi:SIR2 family protein [Bacillus sp. S14(2024)]|uniref:SIR2 family protein n=1 Tax=Bacillus sp. S14(2024) TaxID=3162884 RepID=UPI003D18FF4C
MSSLYDTYLKESLEKLLQCIKEMQCRPILFIGSGLSKRYMGSPSWIGLLEKIVEENPLIDSSLDYYIKDTREGGKDNLPGVAQKLIDPYFKYAFQKKIKESEIFPSYVYLMEFEKDICLKSKAVDIISHYYHEFQVAYDNGTHPALEELSLLSQIDPHAIITTNYDEMLETIFPNYEVIVGQQIIKRSMYTHVGEILKIHGTTKEANSIVLHKEDYEHFMKKKKYLSAQLLTYFIEHPLVIMGYSVQDENIKDILSDIAEMLDDANHLLPNIWLVDWKERLDKEQVMAKEKLIDLGNNRSLRVNVIEVEDYVELYKTLGKSVVVDKVNMKLLRNLSRSVYNIVRSKSSQLQVNIATLNAFSDEEHLFNVLSVQDLNPEALTAIYQYRLSDITNTWGKHNSEGVKVLKQIQERTGYDIRCSPNKYHIDMNVGRKSTADRWYSEAAKQLLTDIYYQRKTMITLGNGEEIEYPILEIECDQISDYAGKMITA